MKVYNTVAIMQENFILHFPNGNGTFGTTNLLFTGILLYA